MSLLLVMGSSGGHAGQEHAGAHPAECAGDESATAPRAAAAAETSSESDAPDLSGTWDIHEEDRTYRATLDAQGNGPYTHQGGSFTTTDVKGRVWSGTWEQTGNDREGGFEVRLSEDGCTAEGDWWYTRVGLFTDIPPRFSGGSYVFQRRQPTDATHAPP